MMDLKFKTIGLVSSSSLFVVLLLLTIAKSGLAAKPCAQKWFYGDRIVCMCNATYCDTLDPVPTLADGQFVQYTSNIAGLRFERTFGTFNTPPLKYGGEISINTNKKFQTIIGFGTAFTDAAGINVNALSFGAQENLLKSYFSPEGIELNFGRVPIAGSDFSTHPYTYDDVQGDSRLKHFNLTSEDYAYKIPLIKRAQAMRKREIYLLAAAWGAPSWMKTSQSIKGIGFLIDRYYAAWSNYHIKFLDAYAKEGVRFWSISTGNEPSNGILPVILFNSLGWTSDTQLKWIREHLGPAIRRSQHNATKIITVDDHRFMLPFWVYSMKIDTKAADYVEGFGIHWYFDQIFSPALLDLAHSHFPNKFILATEACVGFQPWDPERVSLGSWSRGEWYMDSIHQNLNHWSVGWVDWNLALNLQGGPNWVENFVDAAIIVNAEGDEFYKQPTFYALGHFAKFVPEGSVRVKVEGQLESGIQNIAFETPDRHIVVIVMNKKLVKHALSISDPNNGRINLILSERSFQTIIYKK